MCVICVYIPHCVTTNYDRYNRVNVKIKKRQCMKKVPQRCFLGAPVVALLCKRPNLLHVSKSQQPFITQQ